MSQIEQPAEVQTSAATAGLSAAVAHQNELIAQQRLLIAARRSIAEENAHMEEILSEEHHMLSNADLSTLLVDLFGGIESSSVLKSRKPVVSRRRADPLAVARTAQSMVSVVTRPMDDPEEESSPLKQQQSLQQLHDQSLAVEQQLKHTRRVQQQVDILDQNTLGTVIKTRAPARANYAVMLSEQREALERMTLQRAQYSRDIKEFHKKQWDFGV